MSHSLVPADTSAVPLYLLAPDQVEAWASDQRPILQAQLGQHPFEGRQGEVRALIGPHGQVVAALAGLGQGLNRSRQQYPWGGLAETLPSGIYRIEEGDAPAEVVENLALSWLLSSYRFTRYKKASPPRCQLVAPAGVNTARLEAEVASVALTADLINTPANDLGPTALEAAFLDLAQTYGAAAEVTTGSALLEQNFPLIHAVGRASDQAPRLLDMTWGPVAAPKLTLVGKGVCFDTGGLNIKPGGSMGLMKKDMGGSAMVLGLAQLIMGQALPVRLRVLVPAVENSISAGAFRPGDILSARNGLTVEVNNTDAEGRLVLADALALADEEAPDVVVSMATLTGAARVALGPDLPPFFTDDDALAGAIEQCTQGRVCGGDHSRPLPAPLRLSSGILRTFRLLRLDPNRQTRSPERRRQPGRARVV